LNRNFIPASHRGHRIELVAIGIKICEALLDVLHPDPVAFGGRITRSTAVVPDLHPKPVPYPFDLCFYRSTAPLWSDAVFDGIFNEGLQQEAWHKAVQCLWSRIDLYVQTTGKPNLLDSQISFYNSQLLGKRHLLRSLTLQGRSQNVVEMGHGLDRFFISSLNHQTRNRIQCIEEEMGLHLHLESLELGLGELALDLQLLNDCLLHLHPGMKTAHTPQMNP